MSTSIYKLYSKLIPEQWSQQERDLYFVANPHLRTKFGSRKTLIVKDGFVEYEQKNPKKDQKLIREEKEDGTIEIKRLVKEKTKQKRQKKEVVDQPLPKLVRQKRQKKEPEVVKTV